MKAKSAVTNIMKRNEHKGSCYNLTVPERITKARIALQKKSPFFSYLVMHLRFERMDSIGGIGVDPDGYVYYNEEFMKRLTDEEVASVICHECAHCAFIHLERRKTRNPIIYNLSADTWVNNTLQKNGFKLIDGGVVPNNNKTIIWGIPVLDIDKKSVEEIYDELHRGIFNQIGMGKGKGKGGNSGKGTMIDIESGEYQIDEHLETSKHKKAGKGKGEGEKDGKNNGKISKMPSQADGNAGDSSKEEESQKEEEQEESNEDKWRRIVSESFAMAKMRGFAPAGFDRQIDQLLHPQQNWEQILYKYITHELSSDVCWCVDKDIKVSIFFGSKPIKDLKIGNYILGFDEKTRTIKKNIIKNIFKKKINEKFTIQTNSGNKIICSGEHKILTNNGFIPAKNLKEGDIIISSNRKNVGR